jgi:hypothetical protein
MTNVAPIKPKPDYDNLIAHELANVMPMIEGNAKEDLKKDIAEKGILTKIVLFQASGVV